MDDYTALHCRNAALETELRLVKEQLTQTQNASMNLVGLIGHRSSPATQAAQQQEIIKLQSQLEDALGCNKRLQSLLGASRRTVAMLEKGEERRSNGRLRALKRDEVCEGDDDRIDLGLNEPAQGGVAQTGWGLGHRGSTLRDGLGRRKGDDSVEGTKTCPEEEVAATVYRGRSQNINIGDDDEKLRLNGAEWDFSREESGCTTPGTERGLRNGWAARSPSPKSSVAEEVLIEASNGQEYHVSIPKSPKSRWTSPPPRLGRFDRTKYQQSQEEPTFLAHEHRLLAGFACFIEDLEPDEYRKYWFKYCRSHSKHTAYEWRMYYETEIQPAFCQRAVREAAPSPEGRGDSKLMDLIDIDEELDIGEVLQTSESGSSAAALPESGKDVGANGSDILLSSQAAAVNSEDEEVEEVFETESPESEGCATTLPEDDKDLEANAPEILLNGQTAIVHSDDEKVEETVETKTSENECSAVASPEDDKHAEASVPEIFVNGEAAVFHPKDARADETLEKETPHAQPVDSKIQQPFKAGLAHSKHAQTTSETIETGRARPVHMRSVSKEEIKVIPIPAFSPSSSTTDPNLRRGVLITDISVGTALKEVLEGVDSSAIDRASLLKTAGMKTSPPMTSETALVEFCDGRVAREFCAGRKECGFVRLIETETRVPVETCETQGADDGEARR